MRWLPTRIGAVLGCLVATALLATTLGAGESDSPAGSPPAPDAAPAAAVPSDPEPPLHEVIDRFLADTSRVVQGSLAGDAEYLRRLSLDLLGMPPTADEVRAFLADSDPQKRTRAVDRSLNDPRFARHLAGALSVMLLERRSSRFISGDEWENYVLRAVQQNRPLNELVCEILSADGTDANSRPAVQFFVSREADPHLITRDVGRIIFGRDMECAQCHDHPLIDDYLQRDYHAILSVYSSGVLITKQEEGKEVAYYGEQAGKDDIYESVFLEGKHVTGPRLPGEPTMIEPLLLPGEDQEVRPTHADVPRPVASRRAMLARAATDGTNRAFNENVANRLWAHMMGRGLVHPVELHHSANPPTHPELLRILGERLVAMRFNLRTFLRELALTEAYQRSIDPPSLSEDIAARARAQHETLTAEVERIEAVADASVAAFESARDAFDEAEAKLLPAIEAYQAQRATMGTVVQKHTEAAAAAQEVASKLSTQSEALDAVKQVSEKAAVVIQKIPGDEALAAAAKTFQERAASLDAEVTTLRTSAAEKATALEQVTAERTAAADAAKASVAALHPIKEEARALETTLAELRQRMIDDYTLYFRGTEQSGNLEAILAWDEAKAEVATSRQAVSDQEAALAQKQGELAVREQAVAVLRQAAADVQGRTTQVAASLKEHQDGVSAVADQADKLRDALAKINEVKSALGDDNSLTAAAAQLESKIDELASKRSAEEAKLQQAEAELAAVRDQAAAEAQRIATAEAELADLATEIEEASRGVAEAVATADEVAASVDEQWQELLTAWSAAGTVRPLRHLTPEQMCFGMLQATGIYERTWRQSAAELDAEKPLDERARLSAAVWLERNREIERRTYEKLKGHLGTFVQLYSVGAGQPQTEFFASAEQALFVSNGSAVMDWTAPADGSVTARMLQSTEPSTMASELYLSVLSRPPSDEEVAAVAEYVAQRPAEAREAAARELVWGLLTSAEFRFNH